MNLYTIPLDQRPPRQAVAPGAARDYWDALLDEGQVELLYEPATGATLGYADPLLETRNGRWVAVAYALGTSAEREQARLASMRDQMTISPFQARAALAEACLLPQVEALMANPATPDVARLAWLYAQEFRRNSPTIAALAGALGLTDEQLDALFISALGITA